MTAQRRKNGLHGRIKERVQWLRENDYPAVIYSGKALSQIFEVSERTIINWRQSDVINADEIATGVYEYKLADVLNGLEKYIADDND